MTRRARIKTLSEQVISHETSSSVIFWSLNDAKAQWYFKEDLGSFFDETEMHYVAPERTEALLWLTNNLQDKWSWMLVSHEIDGDIRISLVTRLHSRTDAMLYRLTRPTSPVSLGSMVNCQRFFV